MKYLVLLLMISVNGAGRMGIGIPEPPWDWERAKPSRPSPWTSEVAGYYYINDATGTDSGRTYGNPSAPRETIPATLPAGSYVEVAGVYANQSGGQSFVKGTGTTNTWAANTDGPVFITTCPTNQGVFSVPCIWNGTNVIVDSLTWTNQNGTSLRLGSSSTLLRVLNFTIRNCLVKGDGVNAHSGFTTAGFDETNRIVNVVIAYNIITNITDMSSATDSDAMAVSTSTYASNVWVFSNFWSRADGSRAGSSDIGINPEFTRNIYFSSNLVREMRQQGMAIKYGMNCVFSQNDISNVVSTTGASASPGKCIGGQYNPTNWWVIFNKLSHARYPVFMGSGDSGSRPVYFIGNTITKAVREDTGIPHGGGSSDETGMQFNSGYKVYAIGNTFHNCDAAFGHDVPGDNILVLENNIFYPDYTSGAFMIAIENGASTTIKNNIFWDSSSFRVLIGASTYTTLAAMENGTTRTGNFHSNPLFENASAYDFDLQSGSPAINAGLADTSLTVDVFAQYQTLFGVDIRKDFANVTRPQGADWDIGALEFVESSSLVPHRAKPGNNIRLRAR
jgi:hypothetical protein